MVWYWAKNTAKAEKVYDKLLYKSDECIFAVLFGLLNQQKLVT